MACFLLAFCFAKNRIKINLRVRVSRFVFVVVVAVLASLPVYLLWFVFIPALSRIE